MKNRILFTLLFLGLTCIGLTQTSDENTNKKKLFNWNRVGLFGTWGAHFSDYKGVNKILTDSGYAAFHDHQFGFGFGFTGRSDKMIFQLDYYYLVQCNVTPQYYCSHIDYASYGFTLGYDFMHKNKKMDLYPMLGVSRNRTDILLSYVTFPTMPFSNFIYTYSNIARVTRVNFSLNLGSGFDYFIPLGKNISTKLMLGVRAGYYLTINEGTWYIHVDELPLTNAPKTNPGGAYLKTTFGLVF